MKSLQKSDGKIFRPVILTIQWMAIASLWMSGAGCSTRTVRDQHPEAEISLKDDQRSIEELRKNIPEEKRKANDELKSILNDFGQIKEPPERIRDRFQRMSDRQRDKFRRDGQRERDLFDRAEKKRRDEFNEKMTQQREEFNSRHVSNDDRKKFYEDLEQRRRDFNADERTQRDDFNRETKQRSDDFNTDMHDRTIDFNERYRDYVLKYQEAQKGSKHKASGNPLFAPVGGSSTEGDSQ